MRLLISAIQCIAKQMTSPLPTDSLRWNGNFLSTICVDRTAEPWAFSTSRCILGHIEACVDTGVSLVAGNSRSVISHEQAGFFLLGETEPLCCCAQIQDSTTFASANGGVGPLLLQARHVSDQSFQIVCGQIIYCWHTTGSHLRVGLFQQVGQLIR